MINIHKRGERGQNRTKDTATARVENGNADAVLAVGHSMRMNYN